MSSPFEGVNDTDGVSGMAGVVGDIRGIGVGFGFGLSCSDSDSDSDSCSDSGSIQLEVGSWKLGVVSCLPK